MENELDEFVFLNHRYFDAIYEAHYGAFHLKSCVWSILKKDYHNISERLCITFAELCPVCLYQNPTIVFLKESRKPIMSTLGLHTLRKTDYRFAIWGDGIWSVIIQDTLWIQMHSGMQVMLSA